MTTLTVTDAVHNLIRAREAIETALNAFAVAARDAHPPCANEDAMANAVALTAAASITYTSASDLTDAVAALHTAILDALTLTIRTT